MYYVFDEKYEFPLKEFNKLQDAINYVDLFTNKHLSVCELHINGITLIRKYINKYGKDNDIQNYKLYHIEN